MIVFLNTQSSTSIRIYPTHPHPLQMSQVIQLGSDTPCNLLFFLLDGHRDLMKDESAALLREVFQFVCDAQQLSLLQSQLIPTTPPVIAVTNSVIIVPFMNFVISF